MSADQFTDFDIVIRGDAAPYAVTATYRTRIAEGIFDQESTQGFWQQYVHDLVDPVHLPGSQILSAAGRRLFEALIQDDIRDLWVSARTDIETGVQHGLRVRLALQPPAVASLPWECLYDPDRNEAFAANSRTPLVRVENVYRNVAPTRTLQTGLPLTVLLAIPDDVIPSDIVHSNVISSAAMPSNAVPHNGSTPLNSQQEAQRVKDALAPLGHSVQISLLTGRFDVVELRQRLEAEQPDVLHLIGHGQPDGVWLWQRDEPSLTSATALRTILQHCPALKLAFLNVCLAGAPSEHTRFASVGEQLLQEGIPAVIAMQFEIADEAAIQFAQYLYQSLVSGSHPGAIDAAVTYARSNLYALNPDSFAYGTPILWLNAPDGVVFKLADSRRPTSPLPLATDAHSDASFSRAALVIEHTAADELELLQIQTNEVEAWLAQWTEIAVTDTSADIRVLLTVWNDGIRNLHDLFRQLHHLAAEDDAEAIVESYKQKIEQIKKQRAAIANIEEIARQYIKK